MLDTTSVTETTLGGPDWAAIEAEYRAGQKSVRAIAADHGVSHQAISKRARLLGWQREVQPRKFDPGVQAILDECEKREPPAPFPEQAYVADVVVSNEVQKMAIYAADGEIILDFDGDDMLMITMAPGSVPAVIRRLRQLAGDIAANTINQLREIED